jgi:hypothetical protein
MNANKNSNKTTETRGLPMSDADLAVLGLADVAYLRQVTIDGELGFAVYAANGNRLGVAPTREIALAFISEQELEPVSLH